MAFNWEDHPVEPEAAATTPSKAPAADFNWDDHPVDRVSKSMLESAGRGLHQGITAGFQDELAGIGTGLGDFIFETLNPDSGQPHREWLDAYKAGRDDARKENAEAKEDNPWTYGGAEFAGSLAPAIAMSGIPGLEGNNFVSAVKQGAAQGGVMSAGASEADNAQDFVSDVAMGSLVGGGANAAVHGITKLIPADLKERLANFAKEKAVKAFGGERGTIKKLLSQGPDRINTDAVHDLGERILDNDALTPFSSTQDKVAKLQELGDTGWKQMKEGLNMAEGAGGTKTNFAGEEIPQGTMSRYELQGDIQNTLQGFDDDVANKVMKTFEEKFPVRPGEKYTPQQAQDFKNLIKDRANWNNRNPSPEENAFRKVSGIIKDKMEGEIENLQPLFKDSFMEGKSKFQTASQLEEPLTNMVAREQGNKSMGITDWILATAGLTEEGKLSVPFVYAAKKYGEKFGNQQMALTSNKIAKVLEANPGFEKFLTVLNQAAKRGAQPLASTVYILSQQSPEFRDMQNQIDNENK